MDAQSRCCRDREREREREIISISLGFFPFQLTGWAVTLLQPLAVVHRLLRRTLVPLKTCSVWKSFFVLIKLCSLMVLSLLVPLQINTFCLQLGSFAEKVPAKRSWFASVLKCFGADQYDQWACKSFHSVGIRTRRRSMTSDSTFTDDGGMANGDLDFWPRSLSENGLMMFDVNPNVDSCGSLSLVPCGS